MIRLSRLRVLFVMAVLSIQTATGAAEPELVAHYPLTDDARDCSGNGHDGANHGVTFGAVDDGGRAARFDGRSAWIGLPAGLLPMHGDFTVAARVRVTPESDDVPGDILSQYDPATRRGIQLGLHSAHGVTSSQPQWLNVEFGIDNGSQPGEWTDHGRLGEAVLIYSLAVHDGSLFAGTCEAGVEQAGRVFRFDGAKWHDLGAPDRCNAVSSLAVHNGDLYAAVSRYRLAGSALAESDNPHLGGRIYRWQAPNRWIDCGQLPDTEAINGLTVFRGRLYASSMYRPAGFFRYQGGREWVSRGTPDDKRVEALGVFNGRLYATGYDEGAVYRFDGQQWEHLGVLPNATQTYGFTVYRGDLYVSEWPNAAVYRLDGANQEAAKWTPVGHFGDERESMPLMVYNGQMYGGSLPTGEVYRFDGGEDWSRIARLDMTPDVTYRRVWSMAVYKGRLFAGTLPSGRVYSVEIGHVATHDRALEPGWRHIAAVRQHGRLKLYVDGELSGESTAFTPGLDVSNSETLKLGFGPRDYFHGHMRDVRIYSGALSAQAIERLR